MYKNSIRYFIVFLIMGLFHQVEAKEVKNSLWCFTLSDNTKAIASKDIDDFFVRYLDLKTKKWKSVPRALCGWGFQPSFTLESCYQFYAPSNLLALEIIVYKDQHKTNILIDQIPDSISKYKLIGFSGLEIKDKNSEQKFSELKSITLHNEFDQELRRLESRSKTPRIEPQKQRYDSNESIKIYIEAIDSIQMIELYGCGTPGTLYRVQQWINGDWVDYNNTWGVKCAQEKFVINRYIVGLIVERVGIFRVVFDKPTVDKNNFHTLVSTPFRVE